ncbi:MAG: apolipoprotein N-acyltransferase [Nitrospiria bacterium]
MFDPHPLKKAVFTTGNAILSGTLLALSFPHSEQYLLAWVAFVPLFFAIQSKPPRRAFFLGWLAGFVYFWGTISWVERTLIRHGGLSWASGGFFTFLLISYLALYVGCFCAVLRFASFERAPFFFVPSLWVLLEYAKGHLFTGFPWASLAYSQVPFLSMIQIADFGSIYAVAFVILLVNNTLYLWVRSGWQHHCIGWKSLVIPIAIVLSTYLYGKLRLTEPLSQTKSISVAVVQGNIPQDRKWDRTHQDRTIQTYQRLSLSTFSGLKRQRPDLVIWPESALPFIFNAENKYQDVLIRFVRKEKIDLLVGAPSIQTTASGQVVLLNSAYHLSPIEGIRARYDKMHLVPFGEYVPLAGVLYFIEKMVEGVADFIPGNSPTVMQTNRSKFGTVICFEVIFPEEVRRFVKGGAELMTTITNDAWFGHSAAPAQHFAMVVFRAIENRVAFARAANTGISGFIDPYGKIIQQTPQFQETAAIQTLFSANKKTFYTQYGDLFAGLCAIITLLVVSNTYIKRRRQNALPM